MNRRGLESDPRDLPSDLMESFIDEIGVATPSDSDVE